ncbi:MAG: GerMN domain-containing protein [Acidobacteriota bacterium]
MRRTLFLILVVATSVSSACRKAEVTIAEQKMAAQKLSSREITFYFETPALLLGHESRAIPLPGDDSAALAVVVRELLKGPQNPALARPFPPDAVLRAAYLLPEGNAIVDLGGPTLINGWQTGSNQEMISIYSIVQTLTANFTTVKRVHLLVNGQVSETLAGHIDISHPLYPMAQLVAKP